jgi:hypothetical protein
MLRGIRFMVLVAMLLTLDPPIKLVIVYENKKQGRIGMPYCGGCKHGSRVNMHHRKHYGIFQRDFILGREVGNNGSSRRHWRL